MGKKAVRNPFYEKIQREGAYLKVERSASTVPNRPPSNPYMKFFKDGICIIPPRTAAGRPKAGESREPTRTRSIRLPVKVWDLAEKQAEAEKVSLNAGIRNAILIWLKS